MYVPLKLIRWYRNWWGPHILQDDALSGGPPFYYYVLTLNCIAKFNSKHFLWFFFYFCSWLAPTNFKKLIQLRQLFLWSEKRQKKRNIKATIVSKPLQPFDNNWNFIRIDIKINCETARLQVPNGGGGVKKMDLWGCAADTQFKKDSLSIKTFSETP